MTYSVETYTSREEWLEARRGGIGASDVAAILGLIPKWSSPYKLWRQRMGYEAATVENEAMEWGLRLEPVIADKYAQATGRKLVDRGRYTILRSVEHPFMTCTLDREIESERGPGDLEIKTADAFHADEWDVTPPKRYQAQFQAQLAVTGWGWGSLAVLIGGRNFRYWDIERDQKTIPGLIEVCRRFWECVQNGTPPPIDSSEATAKALREQYATQEDTTVELPPESAAWDYELALIGGQIKALKDRETGLKNKLIASIGRASYGLLPGGAGRYQFKLKRTPSFTVAEKSFRELRRVK